MPSPDDAATLQAYGEGVEEARRLADQEWGFDRLPMLVSDDLRAKFRRQQRKWADAYRTAWGLPFLTRGALADVETHAGGMRRAYEAMAAAASEAGHRPVFPDVWEVPLEDGTIAALVKTDAEAHKVITSGRHVNVYTVAEVASIIAALPKVLAEAKVVFPGAKIGNFSREWVKEGDEIPF